MYIIKTLNLENVIYYKKASLDLDYEGITVIKGKNCNIQKGVRRSNGSGKSLLVGCFPSLLGFGSPAANSGKRQATKDLMENGSKIGIDLANDETNYTIVKSLKGTSLKYNLFRNGKDLKPRTSVIAQELISNLFDLTEDELYSLVYLDSRRPYILQIGTSAQRLAFFTRLFRLDDYDIIRGYLNKEINKLKEDQIRKDTLINELDIAKLELSEIDQHKTDRFVKKLELKLSLYNKQLVGCQDKLTLLRIYKTHEPNKKKLYKLAKELDLQVDSKLLQRIKSENKKIEIDLIEIQKYREYNTTRQKLLSKAKVIKRKLSNYEDKIQELFGTLDKSSIEKQYRIRVKKQTKREHEYKQIIQEYNELRDEYYGIKLDKSILKKGMRHIDTTLEDILESRASLRSSIANLQETNTHLQMHIQENKTTCLVCGSRITIKQAKNKIKHNERKIIRKEKLLKEQTTRLMLFRKYTEEQSKQKEKNRLGGILKSLQAEFNTIKNSFDILPIDSIDSYLHLCIDYKKINTELDSNVWKGSIPKQINLKQLEKRKRQLTELGSIYASYIAIESDLKQAEKLFTDNVEDIQLKLECQSTDIRNKINTIQTKLPALKAKLLNLVKLQNRVNTLQQTINDLDTGLKDVKILNLLQEAYSSKGLKMLVAKRIASMIERNMNNYSSLLFPEDFKFRFNIDAGKFDLLVKRKSGKKNRISDVRFLSGAESRAFTLLCLISIMPLIPKNRRLNVCFLDEMEANLDESGKRLFINQFLPALNTIIPHIVIVTPGDESYPNARTFIATKKGNETKLVQGY